jgi:hypothetical protein
MNKTELKQLIKEVVTEVSGWSNYYDTNSDAPTPLSDHSRSADRLGDEEVVRASEVRQLELKVYDLAKAAEEVFQTEPGPEADNALAKLRRALDDYNKTQA